MFPFSPIQVIERTPSRLVIEDPPFYLAGLILLIVSLSLACLWWMKSENDPQGRVGWPALLVAAPFLAIALLLLTNSTTATLSRGNNTLTIERRYLGVGFRKRELPLSEVRNASVATDEQTRGLAIVMKSGEEIWFGSFTDRKGYNAAADAINGFVGHP